MVLPHKIKNIYYQHDSSLVMQVLKTQLRRYLCFLQHRVALSFSSPFSNSTLQSLEESHIRSPHLKSKESWFTTLRKCIFLNYLELCKGDLSLLFDLFIQLFIYASIDPQIFILYFGLLCHTASLYFAQMVASLAIGNSFSWLLCVHDILPSSCHVSFC